MEIEKEKLIEAITKEYPLINKYILKSLLDVNEVQTKILKDLEKTNRHNLNRFLIVLVDLINKGDNNLLKMQRVKTSSTELKQIIRGLKELQEENYSDLSEDIKGLKNPGLEEELNELILKAKKQINKTASEQIKNNSNNIDILYGYLSVVVGLGALNQAFKITVHLYNAYIYNYLKTHYQTSIITGIGTNVYLPTLNEVIKEIEKNWIDLSLYDRIGVNTSKLLRGLSQEILQGIAVGRNPRETAEIISNKFKIMIKQAETIVRTETTRIVNEASFKAYEERFKDSGVKKDNRKYRLVATLDNRTSFICREMDGQEFLFKEKQVGINFPPLHPNCRTTFVVSPFDDIKGKRVARRLDNNQVEYVPNTMTYKQWAKRFIK